MGPPRALNYNTVSDEEADPSVGAKFTIFPPLFPFFQVLFLNLHRNYCHRCQPSVCFGDAPTSSERVSEESEKSITKKDKAQLHWASRVPQAIF